MNKLSKGFIISFSIILVVLFIFSIKFLLSYLYLASENRNFEKMKEKSELDCQLMSLHCAINEDNISQFNILIKDDLNLEVKDNWGNSPLFWSLRHGKMSYVTLLLEKGVDTNTFDESRETIFYYSIRTKNLDFSKLLLVYGADINGFSGLDYPKTSLHFSTMNNRVNATKFLLENGARTDIEDSFGYTVLERIKITSRIGNEIRELLRTNP